MSPLSLLGGVELISILWRASLLSSTTTRKSIETSLWRNKES